MSSNVTRPPHSAFTEREHAPTRAAIRKILGRSLDAWDDVERHLAENYRLTSTFRFMYGERYGWALRFDRGGRLVAAMYPNRGRFTVQVILGRAQVDSAGSTGLPASVTTVLAAAKPYPEGRWLFVPVTSRKGARDLEPLFALKMARPPKAGASGGRTARDGATAQPGESGGR